MNESIDCVKTKRVSQHNASNFIEGSGTFVSLEQYTRMSECIASDSRLFSRYRKETDAQIINRTYRNNSP